MKFRAYQAAGVGEYWLVDADAHQIEPFTLQGGHFVAGPAWTAGDDEVGPACLPGLRFKLGAVFEAEANFAAVRTIMEQA